MLLLQKPSPEAQREFLERQRGTPFSYQTPGCTSAGVSPPGYVRDHARTELGRGADVFAAACAALRAWKMFELGWVAVVDPACPLAAGREVGVLARIGCLWTLNVCRILEVIDGPGRRLGFVYGTLDEHAAEGEERFLVELDSAGRVWFDLVAVSRPHRWYVRAARPVARLLQRRFRRDAAAVMLRAAQLVPQGTEHR
jgi:uncharacterized protein (UPF0548 family)